MSGKEWEPLMSFQLAKLWVFGCNYWWPWPCNDYFRVLDSRAFNGICLVSNSENTLETKKWELFNVLQSALGYN